MEKGRSRRTGPPLLVSPLLAIVTGLAWLYRIRSSMRLTVLIGLLLSSLFCRSQLNGTYTIDPGGGDYPSFNAAVTDLTTLGVSGPVVFDAAPGTYVERVSVGAVAGASAINTITFKSQTNNAADVIISQASATSAVDNYTVRISSSNWVELRDMTIQRTGTGTYGTVVSISGTSSDWTVSDCVLISSSGSSLAGSRYSVYALLSSSIGNSSVSNCTMLNGLGIYFAGATTGNFSATNNSMSSMLYGFYIGNSDCVLNMEGNTIDLLPASGIRGIRLSAISTADITFARNTITGSSSTFRGILIESSSGSTAERIKIHNNMILGDGPAAIGITFLGVVSFVDLVHNSISMTGTGPQGITLVAGSGNDNRIHNNAIRSSLTTLRVDQAARVSSSDSNVFYSSGGSGVQWGATYYATIPTLFAASGMNGNSLMTDPLFVNNTSDLHLTNLSPCIGAGSTFGGLTNDLDNEARPQPVASNTDIGADEVSLSCAPLAGTYVIGASGAANYPTFNDAVNDMISCGIGGPVLFEVEDGTYNERVTLPAITGSSPVNTITFQGQSQDSTMVILNGYLTNTGTFLFDGCSNVTLKWVKVVGSNRVIEIVNNASAITVTNCEAEGLSGATGIGDEFNSIENNLTVTNNRVYGDIAFGLYFHTSNSGAEQVGIQAQGNVIEGVIQDGAFVHNCSDVDFSDNSITSTGSGTTVSHIGLNFEDCSTPLVIRRNKIEWSRGGRALDIDNTTTVGNDTVKVVNNMVVLTSASAFMEAARILSTDDVQFYHNSVSSNNGTNAIHFQYADRIAVVGNIFHSDTETPLDFSNVLINECDENLYYSTSGNAVEYGPDYTLAAWQALASGWDPNSTYADPQFVSATDLHIQLGSPAGGMVSALPGVSVDIDGEARPQPVGYQNDAGADENATACSPLAGTYIVGPSAGADFADFGEARDALNTCGVGAPVIFEVEDGTYNERVTFYAVTGASAVNTITFRGQSLDSTLAILSRPASSTSSIWNPNYTLRFDGAEHFIFEHLTIRRLGNLTYARSVEFLGGASNITIRRCELLSAQIGGTTNNRAAVYCSDNALNTNIQLIENRFDQGHFAIWWYGYGANDELLVQGNDFINTVTYYRGIDGGLEIIDNYFDSNITGVASFMAHIYQCDAGFTLTGNEMDVPNATAIYIQQCAGTPAGRGHVANNMVHGNTGTALNANLSSYVNYLHNSFSRSAYISNGSNNQLYNNIFYTGSGIALTVSNNTTIATSENNCFYNGGTNTVRWNNVFYSDVASLNAATGMDANSVMGDPSFVNPINDLHLQSGSICGGTGFTVASIVTDFDAETRPQPALTDPDIGADETPDYCFLLNGVYVIGPSVGADFPTFNAAVSKMVACGISGPVVFEVESGTYTEQVVLPPIAGNSATNTITFRGQALDSTQVTLRYQATNSATTNYVIRWAGMDHTTFEHMTLERFFVSSSNRYSRVVEYPQLSGTEASQYTTFRNIWFVGDLYSTGFYHTYQQIVWSDNTNDELQTSIMNCRFTDGSYPVYWVQNFDDDRLLVSGNWVEMRYSGFNFLSFDHDLLVTGNRFTGNGYATNPIAITFNACNGGFIVEKNEINMTEATGIYMYNCVGTAGNRGLVRNNTVVLTGNIASNSGLELYGNCTYMDMINNSISLARGRGLDEWCITGNNLRLVNNVFRTQNTGSYAIYKNGGAAYSAASHNCLWTNAGTTFARWNGVVNDLPALQTASGMFANSLECDPLYYNHTNDLHTYSMDLNAAGLSLPEVTDDFDSEVRSANPDIGADEFTPELWTEIHDSCEPTDPVYSDGSGKRLWIYKDRKVVASINDNGNVLGWVNGDVYINSGPIRTSLIGQYYLDRNWRIDPQLPITGANVDIDLYFHQSEFTLLQASDPSVSVVADVGISQYDGPNENCQVADNLAAGTWYVHYLAPNGTMPEIGLTPYRLSASLASFSEFYITTMANPLPVELISFTGRRVDRERVLLDWSTATETNNEGFEIWRRVEGENEFAQVGWVDGAGNSQTTVNYQFDDHNASSSTSYYFLRQVDHNGESESSQMLAIAGMKERIELLLWPNPASTYLQVSGLSFENAEFTITDAKGRNLASGTLSTGLLDVQELPSGLYHLMITTNGETVSRRFVVER